MEDKIIDFALKIDDDFRHVDFFTNEEDFPSIEDEVTNEVRISLLSENEIVGYMEFVVFYNRQIIEYEDGCFECVADGLCQGSYDAMDELSVRGLLKPPKDEDSDDFVAFLSGATVYIRYLAVREDFRRKGYGAWLLRNLPGILERNYRIEPWITVATIEPQIITWGDSRPNFQWPDEKTPADKNMYKILAQLLKTYGYRRIGRTNHYFLKE